MKRGSWSIQGLWEYAKKSLVHDFADITKYRWSLLHFETALYDLKCRRKLRSFHRRVFPSWMVTVKNICFLNFSWLKRTIIDLKHIEACILQVTRGSVLARDSGSSPTFTLVNNWCWCPLLWFMFPLLVELSMGLREISQCPEVPLTALMSPLSVRKRFQCSRGRSATGHSIWASLPLGDFHVYFCLGN